MIINGTFYPDRIEVKPEDAGAIMVGMAKNGYEVKCWTDCDDVIVIEYVHPECDCRRFVVTDEVGIDDECEN